MAGIKYDGGLPYQYITEDVSAGTLTFNPPNSLGINTIQFKLSADDNIIGNSSAATISFYNGLSSAQQATPVTLADVITVLQNLGLVS